MPRGNGLLQAALQKLAAGDAKREQTHVSTTSDRLTEILEDVGRRYEAVGRS